MTNHRIENGRRKFLVTVAGGIAGPTAGSLPVRVLAQPAGGPPLNINTIGAGGFAHKAPERGPFVQNIHLCRQSEAAGRQIKLLDRMMVEQR